MSPVITPTPLPLLASIALGGLCKHIIMDVDAQ